jgi:hypothetical protein
LARKQAFYLEKCLNVQLLQYGKFQNAVMQSYVSLAEAYHTLEEKYKCLHSVHEAKEIKERIGTKDELFEIMADLKISQNEKVKDVDESIKKLDVLIGKFENCKLLEPQKR